MYQIIQIVLLLGTATSFNQIREGEISKLNLIIFEELLKHFH